MDDVPQVDLKMTLVIIEAPTVPGLPKTIAFYPKYVMVHYVGTSEVQVGFDSRDLSVESQSLGTAWSEEGGV